MLKREKIIHDFIKERGADDMASRKVVPMKKRFRPNLALFIFFLILIYLGVITWGYVNKKHVSIYEVNTTNISDDSPMYLSLIHI